MIAPKPILLGLVPLALGLTWALLGNETGASPPAPERASPVAPSVSTAGACIVGDPAESAFWWVRLTEACSAAVAFGPILEDPGGRKQRHFALTVHRPGASAPLAFFQGVLWLDDANPIGAGGQDFAFRLRPKAGLTWADVQGPEPLEADLDGFY